MNQFKAARPVGLSGTLLDTLTAAPAGDHSTAAGLIGATLTGMSSSSLTRETI